MFVVYFDIEMLSLIHFSLLFFLIFVCLFYLFFFFFFFKQKTAYEMRISDWSSDVCSSDLVRQPFVAHCLRRLRRPRRNGAPAAGARGRRRSAPPTSGRAIRRPRRPPTRRGRYRERACRSRAPPDRKSVV